MPTVYIETTVISYLTAQPTRDLIVAAHQQITREWWENVLSEMEPYVSAIVMDEISRGDPGAAADRLKNVSHFPLLEVIPEVHDLAEVYFSSIPIPEKARADSYHLALAAWHGMDYVATWNCTHLASGRVRRILEEINAGRGIRTPMICTPEELMEV